MWDTIRRMKREGQGFQQPCRSAKIQHSDQSGFTMLEFACVVATLALLVALALPAMAQGRTRSQQVICSNNLRMIGQAVLLFNMENNQTDPWRTPGAGYRMASGLGNNAFVQFSFLSNNLSNAKVLACPSDASANPATDFSLSPAGGLLASSYRNRSISYFIGVDSSALLPRSLLSGDRNVPTNGGLSGGCTSGITPVAVVTRSLPVYPWNKGIHEPFGNVLLHDGGVEHANGATLLRLVASSDGDDTSFVHLMLPRPPL